MNATAGGFPPIVMYHAVGEGPDPHHVQVTPQRLREQLRVMKRLGLRGVSMRELLDPQRASRRSVGLTFDDGYVDFADTVVPLLAEFGFTATVFAVAGDLSGDNHWDSPPRRRLMSAEQLREVHRAGHEVGSHGFHHRNLAGIGESERKQELEESRQLLEDVLQVPVPGFCYPYGGIDTVAVAHAERTYDYACAVKVRPNTNRWAIPRFHVGEEDGTVRLLSKLALRRPRERFTGDQLCA